MSNEKGTNGFKDGRKKIDVDQEPATRSQKVDKPTKKNKKNASILTPVFLLFICIPIAFIVYFWKFYDPSSVGEQAKVDENQVVEVAKNSPINSNDSTAVVEEDDEHKESLSDEEKVAAALAAQEAAEKAAKAEAERVAQKVAEEKAAAEAAAEEERRKAEEEEARRQAAIAAEEARKQAEREEAARRAAEQAKQQEQQKQQEKQQQQTARHHTVQPGETIYRISVNYYGNGDAVERIKAANGLGSNEISVGQTLILP